MLRQSHTVHRPRENHGEYDPVIERRSEQMGRHGDHRARPDHELHKAFHAGSIARPEGIR